MSGYYRGMQRWAANVLIVVGAGLSAMTVGFLTLVVFLERPSNAELLLPVMLGFTVMLTVAGILLRRST